MAHHRWSGWPGAWCLDCGTADLCEQALADGAIDFTYDAAGNPTGTIWLDEDKADWINQVLASCPEPESMRHDPYARLSGTRPDYEGANAAL